MVNLEQSPNNLMQFSDFSVLHEIFHPATTTSIDPKLVLSHASSKAPSFLGQGSPGRKDGSPAPVPLSVHELEQARVEAKPEIATLENVTASPHHEGKSSPIDIVHLAAEEIRKPLLKLKDESKVAQTT